MSDALIEAILRADKVFVPYEFQNERKQVSNIILMLNEHYVAYDFRDHHDEYLGPISIDESKLSSSQIQSGLKNVPMETAKAALVNVLHSGVLLDGKYEHVIEGVDLREADGRTLQMRREGAAYPYGLVLEIIHGLEKEK